MSWIKKPTWRLGLAYFGILVLIYYSRMHALSLAIGLVPIVAGQALRVWSAGHLVKNKRLTTTGPYAYVRNPLYLGAITIVIGFCIVGMPPWDLTYSLSNPRMWLYVVFITAFFLYYMPRKMKIEGERLHAIYGEDYERYDRAVPDMLPRLTPYLSGDNTRWTWRQSVDNSEHGTIMSLGVGLALMIGRAWLLWEGIF